MSGFSYDPDADAPPEAFYGPKDLRDAAMTNIAKKKGLNPILKYGPVMAGLGDAFTTRQNIKAGATEANPLLKPVAGSDALYGIEAGAGLLAGLGGDALAKHGHRTLGKMLAGAVLIPMASGAVLNYMHGREHAKAGK